MRLQLTWCIKMHHVRQNAAERKPWRLIRNKVCWGDFPVFRKFVERLKVYKLKLCRRKIYCEACFRLEASCQPFYIAVYGKYALCGILFFCNTIGGHWEKAAVPHPLDKAELGECWVSLSGVSRMDQEWGRRRDSQAQCLGDAARLRWIGYEWRRDSDCIKRRMLWLVLTDLKEERGVGAVGGSFFSGINAQTIRFTCESSAPPTTTVSRIKHGLVYDPAAFLPRLTLDIWFPLRFDNYCQASQRHLTHRFILVISRKCSLQTSITLD